MDMMDMMNITNYESVKDNLMIVVRNKSFVEKYNVNIFKTVGDMMIIPVIKMDDNTIAYIDDNLCEAWNLTNEVIMENAEENSLKVRQLNIMSMYDVFGIQMYIVSNDKKINGAVCLFYKGAMEEISNKYFGGKDFVVFPSSIHEMIVTGNNIDIDYTIVKRINESLVEEFERLSDRVYIYRADTKTLEEA